MSLLSVTVRFLCHVCSPLGPQLYTWQRPLPRDSARRGRKPKNIFMNAPQRIMAPIVSGTVLVAAGSRRLAEQLGHILVPRQLVQEQARPAQLRV